MQSKLARRRARLERVKENIESKLMAAKEKDEGILTKAREKLEFLKTRHPEKAASFELHIRELTVRLAARASLREAKAKEKIEREEHRLAEFEEKVKALR